MSDKVFYRLSVVLFMVAFLVCFGAACMTNAEQKPNGLPDIVAKSVTVKGEKGTGSVSIVATKDGPGIWLTSPSGNLTCITALGRDGGHAICIMKKYEDGFKAANIALAMTGDGEALVQFRTSKGDIRFLPLEKLSDLPLDKLTEGVK